jgi:hypothetical protein
LLTGVFSGDELRLTPWLGQMRPFTMTGASQFLPGGPTALTSEEWVDDYNEVRILGEVDSTVRTPEQGEIGLFAKSDREDDIQV